MSNDAGETQPGRRFQGRFEIRRGMPLQFLDSETADVTSIGGPVVDDQLQELGDALRAYRVAAKELVATKYAELAPDLAAPLRQMCNVTALCCSDGIIVRYDAAPEGAAKVRTAVLAGAVAEWAPKLSDSLLHFPVDSSAYDPGLDGIRLSLRRGAVGGTDTEELMQIRPFIFASLTPPQPVSRSAKRPACLASVTNEIELHMTGILATSDAADGSDSGREFMTRSRFPLPVGWLAIEVYPPLDQGGWDPSLAALWAENDLLATAARRHLIDAQFSAYDPNVAARESIRSRLDQLAALLAGPEEPVHQFLKAHPELLSPTHTRSWSKLPLGNRVTDFVLRLPGDEYVLVELESPLRDLFRKDGQQREELTHAVNQILDWRMYIEKNLTRLQTEVGLRNLSANPRALIVIGRSASLSAENRQKLVSLENQMPRLHIITYDDLIDQTKAMASNLFGPLDLKGENLQVFYAQDRK